MPGVAVVTGASSGIGAAFARALAARGHDLFLVGRRADRLTALASDLRRLNDISADVRVVDLADSSQAETLASSISEIEPKLLVNAAGFGTFGPLANADPSVQRSMVDVHLAVPIRLIEAVLPPMIDHRNGAVIHVASMGALLPEFGQDPRGRYREGPPAPARSARRRRSTTGTHRRLSPARGTDRMSCKIG